MNRRKFLYQTVLGGTGLLMAKGSLNALPFDKAMTSFGVQLYTLRDILFTNPQQVLEQVGALGYNHVELFAYSDGKYFGYSIPEFKKVLADAGLKATSSHIGTGQNNPEQKGTLVNGWEKVVEDAVALGQEYIVCPYLLPNEYESADACKRVAELLNTSAEVATNAGLKFTYHNHAFEFENSFDGNTVMDIFLEETDSSMVHLEMDIYWISKAGLDPIEFMKANKGRVQLWHVKDMTATEEQFFAPVGSGTIDWPKIFKKQGLSGMKYFYVEQDAFQGIEPLQSIEKSIQYLKTL